MNLKSFGPMHELMPDKWFKWQPQLSRAMGTMYADIGRLRVVHVQAKTSTAELKLDLRHDAAGRHRSSVSRPALRLIS